LSEDQLKIRKELLKKHFPEYKLVSISAEENVEPVLKAIEKFRPPKRYLLRYDPNFNFRSFCHEFTKVEEESFVDPWQMVFSIRKPTYGLDFIKRKAEDLTIQIKIEEL
jgi:hypothetical protein